jgi:hypothetical protein
VNAHSAFGQSRKITFGLPIPPHAFDGVLPSAFHLLQGTFVRRVAFGDHLFEMTILCLDDLICGHALMRSIARTTQLLTVMVFISSLPFVVVDPHLHTKREPRPDTTSRDVTRTWLVYTSDSGRLSMSSAQESRTRASCWTSSVSTSDPSTRWVSLLAEIARYRSRSHPSLSHHVDAGHHRNVTATAHNVNGMVATCDNGLPGATMKAVPDVVIRRFDGSALYSALDARRVELWLS